MIEKDLDEALKEGIYSKRPILKVIKLKCMDCCCGSWDEVKKCTSKDTCFLHPYRLGKNPFAVKREYTEEEKAKLREQLARGREAQGQEK